MLTGLGWTLVGPDPQLTVRQSDARHVNWIRSEEATDLRKDFHRLYDKDFGDMSYLETNSHSVQDKKALSLMEGSVKKYENRYQVALPWKSDALEFPYNRSVAETRLESLLRRLVKDKGLLDQYKPKMDGHLSVGHARKVPDDQLPATPRTWYVPHHATKGKLRIVFDCACKFGCTSLNEKLLSGPNLTSNLLAVLLRFREYPTAIASDIKGMFHQVRVAPKDRDSLRFLWWPDHDLTAKPEDSQVKVHLFGATSSPSCCSFILRRFADDNITNASPETILAVKRSFYVDDMLHSVKSVDDAG